MNSDLKKIKERKWEKDIKRKKKEREKSRNSLKRKDVRSWIDKVMEKERSCWKRGSVRKSKRWIEKTEKNRGHERKRKTKKRGKWEIKKKVV